LETERTKLVKRLKEIDRALAALNGAGEEIAAED